MANTPNLDLILPVEGGSADVWGGNLNTDLAKIDAKFNPTGAHVVVQTNAESYIAGTNLVLDDATGSFRQVYMRTAAVNRWSLGVDVTAEGVGDLGADFALYRYSNTGVSIDTSFPVLVANRSNGVVQFGKTPQVMVSGTPFDMVHMGNITTALVSVIEPVGTIKMYAAPQIGSTDPSDYYFFCNGRSLSRTTYSDLWNAIGTTYGAPDGSSFNIPNTAARVIVGHATAIPGDFPPTYDVTSLGKAFGVGTHTLTIAEIPAHNHNLQDPQHAHDLGYNSFTSPGGGGAAANFNSFGSLTGIGNAVKTHSTGITIDSVGGGLAHDNIQPSLVLNFIIRVK